MIPSPRKKPYHWAGAGVGVCCAFLVAYEGYEPTAKHEAIDPPGVITWCFGRTNFDDPSVKAGAHFTKEECEKQLPDSLQKYAAPVAECIPSFDTMPPKRQASLVSFSYNLGSGTLCKSSVARELNAGNIQAGCDAMLKYVYVNGKLCDDAHCGLGRRRRAEREMCLSQ